MTWRDDIVNAFTKMRERPVDQHMPPKPAVIKAVDMMRLEKTAEVDCIENTPLATRDFETEVVTPYSEDDATQFKQKALNLAALAQNSEAVAISETHRANLSRRRSWWVGSLPRGPVNYAAAIKECLDAIEKKHK